MTDDPYARSEDDGESLAQTQEEIQAERDAIDAAASEGDTTDPAPAWAHSEEYKDLGFALAWWDEEHGTPPLDIVVDLANNVCGKVGYLREMEKHGYDSTAMTGYIGVNSLTGPLVVAALQVLGTLHSHLREDVAKVLKQVFTAIPEATEEEIANFQDAYAAMAKAALESQGLEALVFTDPDEAREHIEDMIERAAEAHEDSSLN